MRETKVFKWQVTYASEHVPSFGLDVFDNEGDATVRALELSRLGEKGIALTQLVDTAAVETWQLVDGQWE